MRELDKEGRSPRYVAFISLVTLVFFNLHRKAICNTDIGSLKI